MGRPIVHFEIGCRDKEKTVQFYSELFEWSIAPAGPADMIDTASGGAGIGGHVTALGHEPHNYVNVYAQVDDLQATLDRVEELGGETKIPPTDVPGAGAFAWFADPEGTVMGLWKPLEE